MSSFSSCPNCHRPAMSADDICENCGAILSTLVIAPVRVASTPLPAMPLASTPVGNLAQCPTCKHPLGPGDDICEQCGRVLTAGIGASASLTQERCPHCLQPRNPGTKFCNACGYSYVGATSTSTPTYAASQQAHPAMSITTKSLNIGSLLNSKYKVLKEIGEGGMGTIYLAEDTILKRQVVIKALLNDDDPDMVAQSVKEREFLAAIKHANIVSIYDFIMTGKQGFIVMEYVHGRTLEQMMEATKMPLSVEWAIRYILDILPAFSYLAKLGLVYCDFKPQNVMVETLKDGQEIVKLIDLGTVIKHVPHPNDVYGTHGFYAPEAVKTPSPETDLYTICRTLAYLVTKMDLASPVFGMPSSEYYKPFRVYPALYRLLAKGTHSKPAQRFHSAEELGDQLAGVLRQISGGKPEMPISSKLFVPGILTTTGKLGLRAETALDESDKAIDLLRHGDRALRGGNYTGAQSFYSQASKAYPKSIDAHLRLIEVYIDTDEFSLALAEITRVQRMAPGNWKVAWYTGRLLEAQEKLDEAADQYRELMADLPGELPPQQALARVYARSGHNSAAVDLYMNVLKADPGNTEAVLSVAHTLLILGRWDEVAKVLGSVNEAAARYIDAQMLLIDLYLRHMVPLTLQNVQYAADALHALAGRTEDARYYLARGDVYRAAWQLAREQKIPANTPLTGVTSTHAPALGRVAEQGYKHYLQHAAPSTQREEVVRRKFEVTPWRLF